MSTFWIMMWIIITLGLAATVIYFIVEALTRKQGGIVPAEIIELQDKNQALLIEMAGDKKSLQINVDDLMATKKALEEKTAELQTIREGLARAKSERESAELRIKEQRQEFDQIKEQLQVHFKTIAQGIMDENSQKFTSQNENQINALLMPVTKDLLSFRSKIEETHVSAMRDNVALKEQIKLLAEQSVVMSKEASNLTNALKGQNKIAGNWGELVLERLLESSGLTRGTEYLVQESFTAEGGNRLQPDVIINLPEKKHLVVDSKVSLVAYERYCNFSNMTGQDQLRAHATGNTQEGYLDEHISSLRAHIAGLSSKRYQDLYQINTPDFVILFVPIDAALMAVLQADPKIYTDAFEKGICLTSPTTLLFSLRTIANLWRRQKQETNAIEIAKRGGALYDKFVAFFMKLQSLGEAINKAHSHYEDAMGQLKNGKGSLVRQAEMMRELGARTSKVLPAEVLLEQIDQQEVA